MKNPILYTSALLLTGMAPLVTGCRSSAQQQVAPIVDGNAAMSDPASANLLPAGTQQYAGPATRVAGAQYAAAPRTSGESYPQQTAPNYGPGNSQQNEAYQYNTQQPQNDQQGYDQQGYDQGNTPISGDEYDQYSDLLDSSVPAATQAPPPLPVDYEQPEAPGPDYLWTPGYWDYATSGYYYVPGTWVGAPYAGALWTPGWWGYGSDRYRWHHGYWGRHVGYYGGINYGFGYIGFGYQGGYWNNDHFFYNRSVNRVDARRVNNYVYERRVSVENNRYVNNSHTSYFGGQGGLRRGPTPQEFAAVREQRTPPMQGQIAIRQAASQNRQQFFDTNHGRPGMLVAARPLAADRVTAPPRTMPAQGFANGRFGGAQPNANMNPQQRQQFEQGQRLQVEQQRPGQTQQQDLQRQQQETQRLQGQQGNIQQRQAEQQQRQQLDVQRQQGVQGNIQQRQAEQQQRQQLDVQRQQGVQGNIQQRQAEQQQRQQLDVQRQQGVQGNIQQRQAEQQQRQQLDVQRQQGVQGNIQQRQAEQQQRQQLEVQRQGQVNANTQLQQLQNQQRTQQVQQHQQLDTQRQQQQQVNTQREQQAGQQRQQMDVQRQQQQNVQHQQQMMQQREQTVRPAPAAMPRMEAPRAAPAQPQHMEAPRAAPAQAPHAEGPRPEHH